MKALPPDGYTIPEGRGSSYIDGIRLEPDQALYFTFVLTAR